MERSSQPRFVSNSRLLGEGIEFAHGACRDFEFPPHIHDGFTVGVVVAGQEEIQYRNQWCAVDCGAVYLLAPNVIHSARSYKRSAWRYYSLYLSQNTAFQFSRKSDLSISLPDAPILGGPAASDVKAALMRIASATSLLEAQTCVAAILTSIVGASSTSKFETATGSTSRNLACAVRDYIDAHFESDISLCELARIADWSEQHLVSEFRKAFGTTPYSYVIARRVAAARRRLMRGESISHVAAECGFFDQSHFSRHFTRAYGASPAAYRKSLRQSH